LKFESEGKKKGLRNPKGPLKKGLKGMQKVEKKEEQPKMQYALNLP